MTRYVALLKNNPTGAAWCLQWGADALAAHEQTAAGLGGTVVSSTVTLGQYDQVLLVDFETPSAAIAYALAVTAAGQHADLLPAVTIEDLDAARRLAVECLSPPAAQADE